MKKLTSWVILVLIVVVVGIYVFGGNKSTNMPSDKGSENASSSASVPVIETTKVSSKTSKFENAELGIAVNYPSTWQAENTDRGVTFIIPIDKDQVSTMAKLQADINVFPGKCSFPPVTTIKDRGTLKIGDMTANMISMTNNVQGRAYFNRMYSLQKESLCYMFAFSSIALSPESQKLTGSNVTQAQNNNKALTNTSDSDFTTMVKSFTFVEAKAGQDESKVNPAK